MKLLKNPLAIVKELVENSIDAKSKNIIVKITSGGKNSIEIIDDGEGIHRDDIEKYFFRMPQVKYHQKKIYLI